MTLHVRIQRRVIAAACLCGADDGDQAGALGLLAGAPGLALRCLAGGATKWGAEEYFLDEIAASGAPATPVG